MMNQWSGNLILYLVEAQELDSGKLFSLVERFEADVCRWFSRERERTRYGVQIMSPNGHQGSLPAYKTGTEQHCTGLLSIFNKIDLACLYYLHCLYPSPDILLSTHSKSSYWADLQIFWWSFSCSSMKLSYRSCVKVMSLNTAATA